MQGGTTPFFGSLSACYVLPLSSKSVRSLAVLIADANLFIFRSTIYPSRERLLVEAEAEVEFSSTGLGHEFIVVPLLADNSVLQNNNIVGILNSSKSMGNHGECALFSQTIQRFLDTTFGQSVQCTSCFVQKHNRWILKQALGNGRSLLFTARKFQTAVSYHRIPAFIQTLNKVKKLSILYGLDQLFLRCISLTIQHILVDRIIEHGRRLWNNNKSSREGFVD